MAAAGLASDSLSSVPDDFGLTYHPNYSKLSERAKQKGLNYFTQGYVHDISIFPTESSGLALTAKCWRSMRKSDEPHKLHVDVDTTSKAITEAFCTCKAGLVWKLDSSNRPHLLDGCFISTHCLIEDAALSSDNAGTPNQSPSKSLCHRSSFLRRSVTYAIFWLTKFSKKRFVFLSNHTYGTHECAGFGW